MRVKSNSNVMKVKVTREIRGGFKLIVRKGRSGQELYIITDYGKKEIEEKINECIRKNP